MVEVNPSLVPGDDCTGKRQALPQRRHLPNICSCHVTVLQRRLRLS
jgi:hypothetical protein